MRDKLKDIERTAENAIRELDYFSYSEFEKQFILNNNQFRQRKIRSYASFKTECTFDYSTFLKKFCILHEDDAEPGKISILYFDSASIMMSTRFAELIFKSVIRLVCSLRPLSKFLSSV